MGHLNPPIPRISFEITVAIMKLALTAPASIPPSGIDRRVRVSTLQISRGVRDSFIKDIYSTVVLWSMSDICKFADTLAISPYLGLYVRHLWAGTHEIKLVRSGCEDVFSRLGSILAAVPNLQRLHIAVDLRGYQHEFSCPLPDSVKDLTLPTGWLWKMPRTLLPDGRQGYEVPSSLESLRFRGVPQARDMISAANASTRSPLVVIDTFDPEEEFPEVGAWLNGVLFPGSSWKPLIKIAASRSIFEDAQRHLEYYGRTYGEYFDMERASVIYQPMDDIDQLETWLSEGPLREIGPF